MASEKASEVSSLSSSLSEEMRLLRAVLQCPRNVSVMRLHRNLSFLHCNEGVSSSGMPNCKGVLTKGVS